MGYVMQYGIKKAYKNIGNIKNMAYESKTSYSFWKITGIAAAAFFVLGCICVFYKMNIICFAISEIAVIIFMPAIIFYYYLQKQEDKRFNDVDVYIHQMAYSFQRNPKVNVALEDTSQILTGKAKKTVIKSIKRLETETSSEVYNYALKIIEDEYNCPRIKTLHKLIVDIEQRGGKYYRSLEILLDDFNCWVKRVYKYQDDIKQIKRNSFIGIILSFVLASVSVIISRILEGTAGIDISITNTLLYQVVSLIFILLNIIYFVFVNVSYGREWLNTDRTEKKILKDMRIISDSDNKSIKIFSIITFGIMLAAAFVFLFAKNVPMAVIVGLAGIYMLFVPVINRKKALARIQNDVYVSFSEWLRDIVIHLQDEPLQAAVRETYKDCPVVMKESLGRFIYELEETPSSVKPYYEFMSKFGILDISSTVRMLYSVSELDVDEADEMMNTIIKRNYEIVDKYEENKNQNNLSALRFAEYIPMIFVSLKIAADMLMVITGYL